MATYAVHYAVSERIGSASETIAEMQSQALRNPSVWIVAITLTLLNATKPLHIDDPFIVDVAQQMAAEPFDPYGAQVFWLQWPQPMIEELAPPVLPGWLAAVIRLGGERPLLWKLSLFPFALLLCWSVLSLGQRFCRQRATAILWLALFSPAVLPGFNLMLDIPAMALGLGGLSLFLRGLDQRQMRGLVIAGLLCGLAMQTKYTALLWPLVMLLFAIGRRQFSRWLIVAAVAAAIFVGWEAAMLRRYGQTMFLGQLFGSSIASEFYPRSAMVRPFVMHVGGLFAGIGLAGTAALRLPPALQWTALTGVAASFMSLLFGAWQIEVFTAAGVFVCGTLGFVVLRLARQPPVGCQAGDGDTSAASLDSRHDTRIDSLVLIGWLVLEIAGYFAMAPWPAARRVLGMSVPAALLIGRLSVLVVPAERRLSGWHELRLAVTLNTCLALMYFVIDRREASIQELAVQEIAERVRAVDQSARIWFLGHWGFQYYAEEAGLEPVVPDVSRLEVGDLLVVPEGVPLQEIEFWGGDEFVSVARKEYGVDADDWLSGMTTVPAYYGQVTPLSHDTQFGLPVRLLRVTRSVIPRTSWSYQQVADWTRVVGPGTQQAAIPALVRGLRVGSVPVRVRCAEALGGLSLQTAEVRVALTAALEDPVELVRRTARTALDTSSTTDEPVSRSQ